MGFWESLMAGFLGAAGVDYYAKKTREEVRCLREDLSETINPWDDATAVQAAFAQIHAGIVELHQAIVADTSDELNWHARVSLAFVDLVDVDEYVQGRCETLVRSGVCTGERHGRYGEGGSGKRAMTQLPMIATRHSGGPAKLWERRSLRT